MFTGLITATGTLARVPHGQDGGLRVDVPHFPAPLGASIAVNGICLTVTASDADGFAVQLSPETLARTTASRWQVGERVNLESALKLGDALDGHLVSGHVDGVAHVLSVVPEDGSRRMVLEAPDGLARYIARKGSVTLDGVSLTVNTVEGAQFGVTIIPHTAAVTGIGQWREGTRVNIEIDLLARYVERLIGAGT